MFLYKNYITQYTVHLKAGWTVLYVLVVHKKTTARQRVIKTYKDSIKAIQQNIGNEEGGKVVQGEHRTLLSHQKLSNV